MRVRDHIALSTAAAALLGPRARRQAFALWAGSVLIDGDHYLWFCVRERRVSPIAAVQFFNEAHPPQDAATRALHSPCTLAAVVLVAVRRRGMLPFALGMGGHLALDALHEARMGKARAAALARDELACRSCGARAPHVGTHLWRQPWLLPSYGAQNLVSLCAQCHETAHSRKLGAALWP